MLTHWTDSCLLSGLLSLGWVLGPIQVERVRGLSRRVERPKGSVCTWLLIGLHVGILLLRLLCVWLLTVRICEPSERWPSVGPSLHLIVEVDTACCIYPRILLLSLL